MKSSSHPIRTATPLALLTLLAAVACSDPFEALKRPVPEEPTEVELFDFRTANVRQPTAFDAVRATEVRVDQTSEWDYLFEIDGDGQPRFLPREVVVDEPSTAGLQAMSRSFEAILEAPRDGYVTDAPVPIEEGDVFTGVSRRDDSRAIRCRQFMKLEILSLDPNAGSVLFRHIINPNCEDRNLEPGTGGEEDG